MAETVAAQNETEPQGATPVASEPPVPSIKISESSPSSELADKVRAAIDRAISGESNIDPRALAINGMSGRKYRMFINNLIGSLPDPRYLEIGSWAGSTLCSAISGNKVEALAIDNWSQFNGPSQLFFENLAKFKGSDARVSFLDRDFRAVPWATVGLYNVYLYDGPHAWADQRDGIALVKQALDDQFVFVVDDWNWPGVREGTQRGIREGGLHLQFSAEIRTSMDNKHAPRPFIKQHSDWHNGYFIGVISK